MDGGSAVYGEGRSVVAGSAVYFAAGDPRNQRGPTPGAQTTRRAEITALARALEGDTGDLRIRTDSRHVCDGFEQLDLRYGRAFMRRPLRAEEMPHADLWRRVHCARRRREERGLTTALRWIPSQSRIPPAAAAPGLGAAEEEKDVAGNKGAHELATLARHEEAARRGLPPRRKERRRRPARSAVGVTPRGPRPPPG